MLRPCPLLAGFLIEVTYDQGLMVGIEELGTGADWASSLTWHPNLTLAKVTHGNDLVETIAADANGMARPASISWAQGGTSSGTGSYVFDGAGNVSRMGQDHFQYDQVSRLVFATLGSLGRTQASTFDRYGSLTALATDGQPAQAIPVRGATNRLLAGGYDASGNLLSWSGNTYAWSPVDTLTSWTNGSEGSSYVYTADDERLLALHWANGSQTWTVRDFGNRVLRRDERLPPIALDGEGSQLAPCPSGTPSTQVFCDGFESGNAGGWTSTQSGPARTVTDYVWRGAQLLGSQLIGDPWRHYGLDHLGTIRVVAGDIPDGFLAEHTYFPFGREATDLGQDAEAMKFTGHERDLQTTPANQNDDLDYMHARFSSPVVGRFLSVDPVLQTKRAMTMPQLWNRYSYALGNPLVFTDPTGETVYLVTYTTGNTEGDEELRRAALTQAAAIRAQEGFDPKTDTVLVRGVGTKSDFAGALKEASGLEATFGKVGQVSLFSHSGPADGPVFHDSSGRAAQFRPTELQGLQVNWESGASARFYGCNTAPNFTSAFSSAQGVTSYGYSGYAYFSSDPSRRVNPGEAGPVYMIQAPGLQNGGTLGALKYLLGRAYAEPMTRTDP